MNSFGGCGKMKKSLKGSDRMEKLYNNILLSEDFGTEPSDAQNIPYLKNPPDVINVTVGRQLFVDDFLTEETDLQPEYHKAKKFEGNPILFPQTPWETEGSPVACPKSGGVWYDEEEKLFKMWYEAGWLHQMCYAVSKDGIHWERPALDLEPGTNKILTYEGYVPEKYSDGLEYLRPDSTTVWIDAQAPKEERYKLFLRNPGGESPGIVAVSADGIHFDRFRFTTGVFDRSTVFYNPFRKKWVYSIRSIRKAETWWRIRHYRECEDYLEGAKWTPEEEFMWLECDEADRPAPYIGFPPHLYNVDCVGYESIMLGMFQIMYGPENELCERRGVPKITELMPMYSRDGYHFSRPCRESFIPASMYQGAWDRGYVQSVGGVTVIHGDELWIYYIGFAGDETKCTDSWLTNGMYCNGATGLAKLRRDGFVSMNGTGSLLTRKLEFTGKTGLCINAQGRVTVEFCDENGNALDRATPFCGDSTKAMVEFSSVKISDWNGKVCRLRFEVDGKLYSFGFTDATGDCGGAHAAGRIE